MATSPRPRTNSAPRRKSAERPRHEFVIDQLCWASGMRSPEGAAVPAVDRDDPSLPGSDERNRHRRLPRLFAELSVRPPIRRWWSADWLQPIAQMGPAGTSRGRFQPSTAGGRGTRLRRRRKKDPSERGGVRVPPLPDCATRLPEAMLPPPGASRTRRICARPTCRSSPRRRAVSFSSISTTRSPPCPSARPSPVSMTTTAARRRSSSRAFRLRGSRRGRKRAEVGADNGGDITAIGACSFGPQTTAVGPFLRLRVAR